MSLLTTSLFTSDVPIALGVGYHNIGCGCLYAARPELVQTIERRYGQRCGHVPLDAERVGVLVAVPTPEIEAQWAYMCWSIPLHKP